MEKIASEIGNYLIKASDYVGAGIIAEGIRWFGVSAVGYATIFIIIAIAILVYLTKR